MKKIIAILAVLMLVACSVFAISGTIKIRSKVETPALLEGPKFSFIAGLDKTQLLYSPSDTIGVNAQKLSIKENDISLYFAIVQTNTAGENGKSYSFTITPSEMIQIQDEDGEEPTLPYKTSVGTVTEQAEGKTLGENATVKTDPGFGITYYGEVEENTQLATFTVTWAQDPNAKDGLYEASVTVKVEAE